MVLLLRYHFIVPSLPGYAFSSPPPVDKEFSYPDIAHLFNGLMVGLGFNAYIAQGGDLGSYISRKLAEKYDECKGVSSSTRDVLSY
jgi:microsomal epoxide hydrolase